MATELGTVQKTGDDTYKGKLTGLLSTNPQFRNLEIDIVPFEGGMTERAPDMQIYALGVPIGTARNLKNRKGDPYVNLAFKHPQIFGDTIFGNLAEVTDVDDEDVFTIIVN